MSTTPKFDVVEGDDPTAEDFDISKVIAGKMNPRDGSIGKGSISLGLGLTTDAIYGFNIGLRNYNGGEASATIGCGLYNRGLYNLVGGGNNLLLDGNYILMHGSNNEVTGVQNNSSAIFGNRHVIDTLRYSLVSGRDNKVKNLYNSIVLGYGNNVDSVNTDDTAIIMGSRFNSTNPANKVGTRIISIGSYNDILTDRAVETTLLGQYLKSYSGQLILGKYNVPNENYDVIFANGINPENRNNVLLLPKLHSNLPAKLNCGLDISGTLSASDINSAVYRVTGNFEFPDVFKVDKVGGVQVWGASKFTCNPSARFYNHIQQVTTSKDYLKTDFINQIYDENGNWLGNSTAYIKGADIRLYSTVDSKTSQTKPAIKLSIDENGKGIIKADKFVDANGNEITGGSGGGLTEEEVNTLIEKKGYQTREGVYNIVYAENGMLEERLNEKIDNLDGGGGGSVSSSIDSDFFELIY